MAFDPITYVLAKNGVASATADWLADNLEAPNDPVIDSSLTVQGAAADAKKTGDAISTINAHLTSLDERVTALEAGEETEVEVFDATEF